MRRWLLRVHTGNEMQQPRTAAAPLSNKAPANRHCRHPPLNSSVQVSSKGEAEQRAKTLAAAEAEVAELRRQLEQQQQQALEQAKVILMKPKGCCSWIWKQRA